MISSKTGMLGGVVFSGVFLFERCDMKRSLQHRFQLFDFGGLEEIVERPFPNRFQGVFPVLVPGNHDDLGFPVERQDLPQGP